MAHECLRDKHKTTAPSGSLSGTVLQFRPYTICLEPRSVPAGSGPLPHASQIPSTSGRLSPVCLTYLLLSAEVHDLVFTLVSVARKALGISGKHPSAIYYELSHIINVAGEKADERPTRQRV